MQKYSQNKERNGIYTCKSCNNITYKHSMLEKYGLIIRLSAKNLLRKEEKPA